MEMFVDKVRITVLGGRGGDGAVAFHREKYVASGGPDGGDGGHGGSVILRVNDNLSTLLDFRYKRKYAAQAGMNGQGRKMSGKRGENLIIQVPRGTVVRDAESGAIIVDMSTGEDHILAKGGRGGWGNAHFATPTRQIPRFAKAGLKGQERDVILELKLLADVGLVGFPNVGVIYVDEGVSFVMADIPGIIEGAADGAGLGHDFLRHIDRCRLLVHVVDVSGSEARDPVEDFDAICEELHNYSVDLGDRPMIVAANKCDLLPPDSDNLERLREHVEKAGCELYEISAGTTQGTRNLMRVVAEKLRTLPPVTVYEPEYVEVVEGVADPTDFEIEHLGTTWVVGGEWLERLVVNINFDDYESRNYFDQQLRKCGLFQRLEEMGIQDGDVVSIYDLEFEYQR